MNKRCFTFTKCEYESRCAHAKIDPSRGYFQPEHTGESCNFFQPTNVESDPWHGLSNKAGAHE